MTAPASEMLLETEEPLEYLSEAVAAAAALKAAVRLGVLDRLDAEGATVQELAAACGIDEAGAERLINALAGLGLVEFYDGRWRSLQPDLSGLGRMTAMWDHLDVALREGRPLVRADRADGAAAFYPEVVGNLGRMLGAAAQRAATLLPTAAHVLDAGAGAAPWSLAYASRHPRCVVTAVDLPTIVLATRRAVINAGRAGQFELVSGDLFDVELPRGRYDLVIAGNICHLFDGAANRRLLSVLYDALAPGGTLAIADIVPEEGRSSRAAALYALGLQLRTGSGGVHQRSAYQGWLADAGFQPPELHQLVDDFPLMLIIARKPGA